MYGIYKANYWKEAGLKVKIYIGEIKSKCILVKAFKSFFFLSKTAQYKYTIHPVDICNLQKEISNDDHLIRYDWYFPNWTNLNLSSNITIRPLVVTTNLLNVSLFSIQQAKARWPW